MSKNSIKMNTLASLAMLKTNINLEKDYLSNLEPYILYILSKDESSFNITDLDVSTALRNLCGLKIPTRTVQTILKRLSKNGYLFREGKVFIKKDKLKQENFSQKFENNKEKVSSSIDILIEDIKKFALSENNITLDSEKTINLIFEFLSYFCIPCLEAFMEGNKLPSFEENTLPDFEKKDEKDGITVALIGKFLQSLPPESVTFTRFQDVVEGHMLANAFIAPDTDNKKKKFSNINFYFDTPLLIKVIGLNGDEEKEIITELVKLLKILDSKLYYFDHTLNELKRVIQYAAHSINTPYGKGSIIKTALSSGRSKSDLLLELEKVEENLYKIGFNMKKAPSYDRKNYEFEIDEVSLRNKLNDIRYPNESAIDHDISSIRAIHVIRGNSIFHNLEDAKAIFVTSNTPLSRAAYYFGKDYPTSQHIPTVITDFSLVNIAWLKAPTQAPDIPKKEIIAYAFAALKPTDEYWSKVLRECEKLKNDDKISEEDYELLKYSQAAQDNFMRYTLGSDKAFENGTVPEILEQIKKNINKELEKENKNTHRKLEEANKKNNTLENEYEKMKKSIEDHINRKSNSFGRLVYRFMWCLYISIMLSAIFGILFKEWGFHNSGLYTLFFTILQIIGAIIACLKNGYAIKPKTMESMAIKWRKKQLIKKNPQFAMYLTSDDEITNIQDE